MTEAGFSTALVKTRVQQVVSMEICSQQQDSQENTTNLQLLGGRNTCPHRSFSQFGGLFIKFVDHVNDQIVGVDYVTNASNSVVSKRKKTLIIWDSLTSVEGVARRVMQRLENPQGEFRFLQFVSLPLFSFSNISKKEVERKLVEVRSMV